MAEPKPARQQCSVTSEMVESIRAVTEQLITLHRQEIEAVRCWDIDAMERIDHDLEKANEYRDSLLESLNSHVKTHGCQEAQARGPVQSHGGRTESEELPEPNRPDEGGEQAHGGAEDGRSREQRGVEK